MAVGEAQNRPFQLSFNSSLKVDFQGSGVTSDGGLDLVADQLAAAAGENRRAFDKTRPLLLVAAGGESPDAVVVRRHAAEDRGAAGPGGIRRAQSGADFGDETGGKGLSV